MSQYKTLLFGVADGVATITLNRPDDANAINDAMARDLREAATRCDEDPAIRAILITGSGGKAFSVGGDLKAFNAEGDNMPAHLKGVTGDFHLAVSRFMRTDAPVIIAINGVAAGGGMSFSLAGDIVLMADTAFMTMAYTAAGLTPDGSSTWFLPRIVGLRKAMDLTLNNARITAEEAAALGLVTRVVPAGDLMDEAMALARTYASGPTRSYGAVKRLMQDSFLNPLETQMELESRYLADMVRGRDGREGVDAFANKRKPDFTGE